jgi:hypothetical protein
MRKVLHELNHHRPRAARDVEETFHAQEVWAA